MSTRALDTTTPIHLDPAGVAKYYNSPLTQNLSLLDIVALHNAELHVSKEILTEHEGFQTRIKTFETELNQIVEALLGQHIGAPEEWPQYVVDWKNSWSEFVRDCGEGEDICRRVRVSLKELLTKIQANQSVSSADLLPIDGYSQVLTNVNLLNRKRGRSASRLKN
jgi:hypothetical protein